jgi:hypothetical protein
MIVFERKTKLFCRRQPLFLIRTLFKNIVRSLAGINTEISMFFQLRSGQTVCTDNECTDLVSPQSASTGGDTADNFTWMMFMMIAAVILYLIR